MAKKMLSPHFSAVECRCQCSRHKDGDYCYVSPRLLTLAEKIRSVAGVMTVHSCCRCPAHNAEVGGVKASKHVGTPDSPARAMDFHVKGSTPLAVYTAILKAYAAGELPELGGIGLYDAFVHIDTAKAADGHLRKWDYRKRKGA